MIPRSSFSMDAQNRAADLASAILSASTPPQITAACSAVESFLRRHAADQSRVFFSSAFPLLIQRLFGFDEQPQNPSNGAASGGWIDRGQTDPELAARIFELLSPEGVLVSTIANVDRHGLVKYVFPPERLPEWMRFALSSKHQVLSELCPLFKSRVKEDNIQGSCQLQLNVFEYYVFWFAYYPVFRGSNDSSNEARVRKNRRFRLESWTSSLPGLTSAGRRSGQKPECSLYLRLLYAHLRAFVPKCAMGAHQPYRSSLLHYSSVYDGWAFNQAEFFVYTLTQFWMVDNDFSPLPVSLCRSFGISFPLRAVLGETPPTADLGEVLKLVVKYLNSILIAPAEEKDQMVYDGTPGGKFSRFSDGRKSESALVSCENAVGSWNSVMQRPLYRFILRSFLFCPMGTSMKNATQVFSLWATYLEPWKTTPVDFFEFDMSVVQNQEGSKKNNERKDESQVESSYMPVWQGYVLSNYLFYSSLVVHFLGFAHKFLHANVETMVTMVLKVLNILTASEELMDLLKKVDAAYHSEPAGPSSVLHSAHKFVPSIREQLEDWEDGLCESDADGSYLHENWNRDLRLFSAAESGAQNLLQLFVLRAEHEIRDVSGDVSQSFQALDSIRTKMNVLFGDSVQSSQPPTTSEEAHALHPGRGEMFTPKHPGVRERKWADAKYKGDWLNRPVSDGEVALLVRPLVRLSAWLNEALGLDKVDNGESSGPIFVEAPREETSVSGPKEALYMVFCLVCSWLRLFGQSVVRFMKAHGLRINLRLLASKKVVLLLVLYAVVFAMKKAFGWLLQS